MFTPVRLPADAQISQWKAGRAYAYGLDANAGLLYVINVRDERVDVHEMPLLKPVISAAVGLDDRLWLAVRGAPYLLAYDPLKGALSSFDLGAARVSLLAIDSLGRIIYADDSRSTAGVFDPKAQVLNEVRLPAHAPTTGLVVDSSSTLWVGTTAGEIFNVRGGRAALVVALQVPVAGLSLDQTGHVWYLAPLPKGASGFGFAALDEGVAGSQVNGPVVSLDFSALGHAWLADPRGGFFVSREQLR
jgi:ligand-binding sensor domain-containing protein